MKIAVVGAGIFGTTAAIALAKEGFEVDLFEKEEEILRGASGANQFRLHRGYHYPRSFKTAISSRIAEDSFLSEYGDAVSRSFDHYYCVAKEKSKVTGKEFLDFCDSVGLEYSIVDSLPVDSSLIDLTIKAKESIIDPFTLKNIIKKRIKKHGVKLYLDTPFQLPGNKYNYVINCTYANLNHLHQKNQLYKQEFQFEVCEKPVVKLPKIFSRKSIVVMDGPFFCLDPYGKTNYHLMGNVTHAIHLTNTGHQPEIPESIKPLLHKGLIKKPQVTNFQKFIENASAYIPELSKAEHVGSFYTIRTVLPNTDQTDERPTIVTRINDKIIQVFSGKIGNCVEAADEVVKMVRVNKVKSTGFFHGLRSFFHTKK